MCIRDSYHAAPLAGSRAPVLQLLQQGFQLPRARGVCGRLPLAGGDALAVAPHLGGDGLAAQAALADLLLQRRNGRIVVGNVVFKHRDAGIRPGNLLRYGPYFRVAAVGFGDQMLDLRAGALGLGVNGDVYKRQAPAWKYPF